MAFFGKVFSTRATRCLRLLLLFPEDFLGFFTLTREPLRAFACTALADRFIDPDLDLFDRVGAFSAGRFTFLLKRLLAPSHILFAPLICLSPNTDWSTNSLGRPEYSESESTKRFLASLAVTILVFGSHHPLLGLRWIQPYRVYVGLGRIYLLRGKNPNNLKFPPSGPPSFKTNEYHRTFQRRVPQQKVLELINIRCVIDTANFFPDLDGTRGGG
jgi:hypothetical protein